MVLAKSGDPYIDTSGELISPDDNALFDVPEKRQRLPALKTIKVRRHCALDNLPEPDYEQQVVISAIIGLRLMGTEPTDICEMLNISIVRLNDIITSPAAQTSFELLYKNVINTGADVVQGRIAAYANNAVDTVVDLMENEDVRDDVRLKAAQDVLDRSGTNADNFFGASENDMQSDDELRIVVMDEEGEKEKVKIDIKKKK